MANTHNVYSSSTSITRGGAGIRCACGWRIEAAATLNDAIDAYAEHYSSAPQLA